MHALRKFREENGLTLEDAAIALNVSGANLSRIETGKHSASADLMKRIAKWTGGRVTPNDLLIVSPERAEALRQGIG